MKNLYPHQKFSAAITSMASSPKPIQERLGDAFLYHLIHVKPADLPEHVREKFSYLLARIVMVGSDQGTIAATVKYMSEEQAVELAADVVFIADAVASDAHS